jgi:hypothetical protein
MGLLNWIFDIYQHSKIDDAQREASSMRAEIAALRSSGGGVDAARLEAAIGELALATKTMQRLIIEKGLCTADELGAKLREIDAEDGRIDGRTTV